ncbi:MAG: hypothetical protein ACFFCT_13750 [Candidatus Odinarchaeota archaeon]
MKKMRFLILLTILTLLPLSVVDADTIVNHGLQWGIDLGDQFHYRFSINYPLHTEDNEVLDFYLEITDLPEIPENISLVPRIAPYMGSYVTLYYENGTSIDDSIATNIPWRAYPIGNWSLIEEMLLERANTSIATYEILDAEREWGVITTQEWSLGSGIMTHVERIVFSKSEGVMNSLLFENTMSGEGVTFQMKMERADIQDIIIIGSIGIGGIAIIFGLFFLWRRRK